MVLIEDIAEEAEGSGSSFETSESVSGVLGQLSARLALPPDLLPSFLEEDKRGSTDALFDPWSDCSIGQTVIIQKRSIRNSTKYREQRVVARLPRSRPGESG